MAIRSVNELKQWFETNDKPTQQQFYDWLESFIHKQEGIAIADVNGLVLALSNKADQAALQSLIDLLYPFRVVLTANGSYVLPAGLMMEKLIITPVADSTLKIGTTDGGDEIMPEDDVTANTDRVVSIDVVARVGTTIYFTGIVATTTILIYRKTLTHANV